MLEALKGKGPPSFPGAPMACRWDGLVCQITYFGSLHVSLSHHFYLINYYHALLQYCVPSLYSVIIISTCTLQYKFH